jgi:hypothetical protein
MQDLDISKPHLLVPLNIGKGLRRVQVVRLSSPN